MKYSRLIKINRFTKRKTRSWNLIKVYEILRRSPWIIFGYTINYFKIHVFTLFYFEISHTIAKNTTYFRISPAIIYGTA